MSTANDVIAHSLAASHRMLQRFTGDLEPAEYLHRPTAKANCAAWLIGHMTLSDRYVLKMFGVTDLPTLPDGFENRFSRNEGCPEAGDFGDVSTLMPLFNEHRTLLVEAVKRATPEQLDKKLEKSMPMFATVGEFTNFMAQHTAMHTGQITIIRRSLGRPPLI